MVAKLHKSGQDIFRCEVCGFGYATEELAQKCESWCRESGSCNIDIIEQAILGPEE